MDKQTLELKIDILNKELIFLKSIKTGCNSCMNTEGKSKRCKTWDDYIPEDNYSTGCDRWEYDGIPF